MISRKVTIVVFILHPTLQVDIESTDPTLQALHAFFKIFISQLAASPGTGVARFFLNTA